MVLGFVFYLNLFMAVLILDCESGRGGGGWGEVGRGTLTQSNEWNHFVGEKKTFYTLSKWNKHFVYVFTYLVFVLLFYPIRYKMFCCLET